MSATSDLSFINALSPTQEHFLKKFLIEEQLSNELHYLSKPQCLQYLGPPFSASKEDQQKLPLLKYFFSNFVATFPLIANNTEHDQVVFWRDTVEPFVNSFNSKNMSEASERHELVTKRHQVNHKLLSSLLLFYNSMIVSKRDMDYLEADHVKSSDQGKLQKLGKGPNMSTVGLEDFQKPASLDDYSLMRFVNDLNLNIVAVDVVSEIDDSSQWSINPLKMFSAPQVRKLNYYFVIQVTRRTEKAKKLTYRSHFIARPYLEFRQLESLLRKKYPGLMTTDVNRIPRKIKHDEGIVLDEEATNPSDETSSSVSSGTLAKKGANVKFQREKLRLALRGYLNTLLSKPEIAHCDVFNEFIDNKTKNFYRLTPTQTADYLQRLDLEKKRLDTQQEFQEKTAKVMYSLSKDFDNFKTQLVRQPHQLTNLFEELSHTSNPDDVSSLLRTFVEWCKLEVAATLYQVFLTQDNSSEWFHKCRKFHRLFPYNLCYGVLKYTNPVRIMSRLVDVLLVNVPTLSWGSLQDEKKVNNLLSMLFVMLLDEDLEDYLKERTKLLELAPLDHPEFKIFIDRINAYVRDKDLVISEEIKEETLASGKNLLITILQTDKLAPRLTEKDQNVMKLIQDSYAAYESLKKHRQIEETKAFVNLRQLWQLEVRARDKKLLKQLWQEEELTQLIKKFLTVFFQPMMTVMKKCDIHLVFRDWQNFMNDLMDELTKFDQGEMYYMSSVEMFDRFKALLDKHEGALWRFMHNLYVKDDQRIFLGIVEWIEGFLVMLRHKFSDPARVTLDLASMQPSEPINPEKFVDELDQRIHAIVEKRRLLKDYLHHAAHNTAESNKVHLAATEPTSSDILQGMTQGSEQSQECSSRSQQLPTRQQVIDDKWNQINSGLFQVDGSGFGVAAADIEDFNLGHMHGNTADGMDEDEAHRQILQQVAALDRQLRQLVAGGELFKMSESTHLHLCRLLHG